MKLIAAPVAALLSLNACAMPPVDLCKNAAARRSVYTSAITAADMWASSGRPVPSSVALGREAAATALAVLNGHCPVPKAG